MKYKVGDKVRIVKEETNDMDTFGEMAKYLGTTMTIQSVNEVIDKQPYKMVEDQGKWFWSDNMIEGLVEGGGSMKTWEIWKMIDEDYEKMEGKKYKLVKTAVNIENFNIGDIANIGKNAYGAPCLFNGNWRIDVRGFEEWEEVKEPVTWKEAFEAGLKGKNIKPEGQYLTFRDYESLDYAIQYLAERPSYYKKIMLGKWHIE